MNWLLRKMRLTIEIHNNSNGGSKNVNNIKSFGYG